MNIPLNGLDLFQPVYFLHKKAGNDDCFLGLPFGAGLQFEKYCQYYDVVKAVNIVTAWKLPDGSGYPAEDFVRGFVAE